MARTTMVMKHGPNQIEMHFASGVKYFLGPHAEEELRVWLNARKDQPVSTPLDVHLTTTSE